MLHTLIRNISLSNACALILQSIGIIGKGRICGICEEFTVLTDVELYGNAPVFVAKRICSELLYWPTQLVEEPDAFQSPLVGQAVTVQFDGYDAFGIVFGATDHCYFVRSYI